jgi:very-short-patch-repair endonuclease
MQFAKARIHKRIAEYAKKGRRTKAELAMREILNIHFPGFAEQQPIDLYIADFLHRKLRVVIEVDGECHFNQTERDELRTKRLRAMGYKVVRFVNHDVLYRPELVIEQVTALRGPEFAIRTS